MKQLITGIIFLFGNHAISQCKVCYSLEEALKSPKNVEELHLGNSQFARIDSTFKTFTSLKVLDLSYNPVIEVDEGLFLPSLEELKISHCAYNPWKIGAIGKAFPNLKQLDLSDNNLVFIWSGLQSLNSLTRLNVSGNQLQEIPVEIMYLNNLKELDLSRNNIRLRANELGALWSLESLDITSNAGLSSNNLVLSLAENKHLKKLAIDGNQLTPGSIQLLSRMNLEKLALAHVQEPCEIDFTRFPGIKTLSFLRSSDWLSPDYTKKFDQISSLELTSSSIPESLKTLKSLRTLTLNQVEGDQFSRLFSLKKLHTLDITNTDFTETQIKLLQQELPDTRIISKLTDVSPKMSSNQVKALVEIPAQEFTIQANEAGTIAEKNVSLAIPQNAFLDPRGEVYKGEVKVALTVYDNAIETALAGIPMTFNEKGREEIFASNGMFRFEAKGENGEVLQPNPDNLIQASVGDLQPQNSGGLFAFNTQNSQWVTISDSVNRNNRNLRIQQIMDSINKLDLKNLVPRVLNDRLFAIYPKFSRYDRTQITLYSRYLPTQNNQAIVYNRSNFIGKMMTKQTWVIDTIVNPEMKKQLKLMKKETKAWHAKKMRNKSSRVFIPRLMNNLTITPDSQHDNYRLTFHYRDSVVSIPVALSGNTNRQIQKSTAKFQSDSKMALSKDKKEQAAYEKSLDEQLANAENALRQQLLMTEISKLPNMQSGAIIWNSPNRLNFGLSSFGLVNCDFFMRKRPDYTAVLKEELIDQNGEKYPLPPTLITVDPRNNYYMEVVSSYPVNYFSSTYFVFDLGEKKLGVAKPRSKGAIEEITVIDINDKSAKEISKAILSL